MATQAGDDPLTSALPPATDYMTYLTLLEYQLTPENLPTLSKLLSDDDGKLAEEIGWDLLRLLLPMLIFTPDEAYSCLEIVARRGNPREVVVRVAEELEKLGDKSNEEGDFEQEDDQDELPTFPGEAPRVHLGQMTLEGMPEQTEPPSQSALESSATQQTNSIKALELEALLNMLSILHPRIKTQYPSRFLATSLPAALGAFRQIPITADTTSAFLNMLEKLAGKKRPPLPPRTATQGDGPPSSAPLPDPEAKAEEENTGVKVPSEAENAITFRLLDAVLLEVLDEYISSLATQEYPSMSWTTRLREQLDPKRVVPGRPTETELWKQTPELHERDNLLPRFLSISQELRLDTSTEIRKIIDEPEDEEKQDPYHEQEQSEYPTTPSQIPFPSAGVIFLHAYRSFIDPTATTLLLTTTELTKLIAHSFPLSATPTIPLPALQDSLLSLLFKQTLATVAAPTTPQPLPAKFLLLLSTLTQLFTITPYPTLRDAAHYMATKLLHAYPDPAIRIRVINQTLRGSTLSTNWSEIEDEDITAMEKGPAEPEIEPETGLTRSTSALIPHPIPLAPPQQLGQLKALGVDWLKEEFVTWIGSRLHTDKEDTAPTVVGALDPVEVLSTPEEGVKGKETDDETPSLVDLLFPPDLPVLPNPTTSSADDSDAADTLTDFLLSIPFYISTLNLSCVVLPHLHPSSPAVESLKSRISTHLTSLNKSSQFLTEVLQHAQSSSVNATSSEQGEDGGPTGGGEEAGFLEESRADIFALEDACARATEAWEKLGH